MRADIFKTERFTFTAKVSELWIRLTYITYPKVFIPVKHLKHQDDYDGNKASSYIYLVFVFAIILGISCKVNDPPSVIYNPLSVLRPLLFLRLYFNSFAGSYYRAVLVANKRTVTTQFEVKLRCGQECSFLHDKREGEK